MRDFALSAYDAGVLVAERETADYFEAVAKGRDAKAGGQLGDQRIVRTAQQGGQGHRVLAGIAPRSSAPSST